MSSGADVEKLKEKLKDITECSICTETLTDPRCLPCVHTFCLKCLQTYGENKKTSDGNNVMECPFCRKPFTLDSNGFEELPVNHFINKLIEENSMGGKEESGELMKKEKPAEGYCVDCREQMCNSCIQRHGLQRLLKFHKPVTMDQKPSPDALLKMSANYCHIHPNQELILYCADCQKTSCVVCYVSEHKEHKCSDIVKSSTEMSQQIDQCAVKIKNHMSQTEAAVKQIDITVVEFEKQIKTAEGSITRKSKEMIALLASQYEQLKDQLSGIKAKRLKELQTLRDEMEYEFRMMKSFERYWNKMKERGSACDIVQAASSLQKGAEELVEQHEKQQPERDQMSRSSHYRVQFVSTEIRSGENENLFGEICENVLSLKNSADWRMMLQSVNTEIVLPAGGQSIQGITVHKEQLFIVRCGSGNIEVYNINDTSRPSRQIGITGLSQAVGIISCAVNNCLYVSDYSSSSIHRIYLSDDSTINWKVQSDQPWGLSLSRQHHLLVSIYNAGRIEEYDTTGRLVRNIQLSGGIQGIHHAIELKTGQFVVAEWSPQSRVHVMDSSGTIVHTYGQGHGSSTGQLHNPRHIEVDDSGNLLVVDQYNDKLRVFSDTLKHLGDIPTEPGQLNSSLCSQWDRENGRLLIGNQSGKLVGVCRNMQT